MITIIIVNYNRKHLLKDCLDSLRAQTFKDIEVIVVDNASNDGSNEMISGYYPEVKLMRNNSNLFFCKAQNQGIEEAKGDFVLSLNSDCVLDKGYLQAALSSMAIDKRIGMACGKILRQDKKTIDSTGLFLGRNRKAIERGYGKKDTGRYEMPEYIFGVSGACAFLRKAMLDDIKDENGYFDESFGMYYEDMDLCWRANKKGWKGYYNPKAIAYHIRGGSVRRTTILKIGLPLFWHLPENLQKRYLINRYKCMKKNDSLFRVILNLPFILLYELKILLYLLIKTLDFVQPEYYIKKNRR